MGFFRASYTSGESLPVASDAQTTNFGGDLDPNKTHHQKVAGRNNGDTSIFLNGTRECAANTFGVVFLPFPKTPKSRVKAIPVAIRPGARGVGLYSGPTHGATPGFVPMVLGEDAVRQNLPGIDSQYTSKIKYSYEGQL